MRVCCWDDVRGTTEFVLWESSYGEECECIKWHVGHLRTFRGTQLRVSVHQVQVWKSETARSRLSAVESGGLYLLCEFSFALRDRPVENIRCKEVLGQ